jgi:putative CocE/NonD family hydrolase
MSGQRISFTAAALATAFITGCGGGGSSTAAFIPPLPPPPAVPEAVVQDGVSCSIEMVKMRDGVEIYTEIYQPVAGGQFPVTMIRNPYAALLGDGCFKGLTGPSAATWARNGYVGVAQEVRGTAKSGGSFVPFFQEQEDGYDAIEWAGKQAWSNGKVVTTAGSYLGVTQWQAAIKTPPSLVAISPQVTPIDYRDDWVGRNGVFDLQFARIWGLSFVSDAINRDSKLAGRSQADASTALNNWQKNYADNSGWIASLPLNSTWSLTAKQLAPYIWDWYAHPNYDEYWAKIDIGAQMSNVKVPALISGGWYDLFTKGTIDSYLSIKTAGGSSTARDDSMLVMDCCGHGAQQPDPNQITWGENKSGMSLTGVSLLTIGWMNKYAKGDTSINGEPRVQLTVLVPPDQGTKGDNFIFKTTDFPVPGTEYLNFALSSAGSANTSAGDGQLLEKGSPSGPPDRFTYDPLNPVQTVGGNSAGLASDQREVAKRSDILVYTSDALTASKAIIGKVSVRFWAATSAVDTDFTAKLVDVHPDGYAHNVVDNIVRAKFRKGSKLAPEPITPGQAAEYQLDIGYTATMFKAGHKIRLEISSSNFPHYARNLNNGDPEGSSQPVVASQTIYHSTQMPSTLTLPVVPSVQN